MSTTSKSTEIRKDPIYPPDRKRAALYWAVSFASFCYAAWILNFFLIFLTGITMATASAQLGEQLYKGRVYKEILFHRALDMENEG